MKEINLINVSENNWSNSNLKAMSNDEPCCTCSCICTTQPPQQAVNAATETTNVKESGQPTSNNFTSLR